MGLVRFRYIWTFETGLIEYKLWNIIKLLFITHIVLLATTNIQATQIFHINLNNLCQTNHRINVYSIPIVAQKNCSKIRTPAEAYWYTV